MRLQSEIRGVSLFGQPAFDRYWRLGEAQPLLMIREPSNHVDPNAIILTTLFAEKIGYMAREHAKIVAPLLDRGCPLLCRVAGKPAILVYREDPKPRAVTRRSKRKLADA